MFIQVRSAFIKSPLSALAIFFLHSVPIQGQQPLLAHPLKPIVFSCAQALSDTPHTTYRYVEYFDTDTFSILLAVNRVFVEYPHEYLKTNQYWTELVIPESRWNEIFNKDFDEVIADLSQSLIYRVDNYRGDQQKRVDESDLLLDFGKRQKENGESILFFRIDPKIINLIKSHKEPAIAAMYLKTGLFQIKYMN